MLATRWTKALVLFGVLLLPGLLWVSAEAADYRTLPWRYGNWGGGGYSNGTTGGEVWGSVEPVDALDTIFRDHDRGYASADERYEDDYRKAFAAAAQQVRRKTPFLHNELVRKLARQDGAVAKVWKKWKGAYESADGKAVKAAKALAAHPTGRDPVTGKQLKGTEWSACKGTPRPSDGVRALKRLEFIAVGASPLMNDPPRNATEDQIL